MTFELKDNCQRFDNSWFPEQTEYRNNQADQSAPDHFFWRGYVIIVPATRTAIGKFGGSLKDFTPGQLGWDIEKVNVNGGAIALGHPMVTGGSP